MPCNDITDSLKILLDPEDRLQKYALRKKTCGSDVGRRSLLLKWFRNKSAEEILALSPEALFLEYPTNSKTWEYLYVKHFLAVKSGLSIMLGKEPGGINDYCTVDSIEYTPEGTIIQVEISVEGMTDDIKACGNCNSCGSVKSH